MVAVRRSALLGLATVVALLLDGCAMFELRRDLQAYPAWVVVHGRVEAPLGYAAPVMVVAEFEDAGLASGPRVLRLERPGPFELILAQRPQRIVVYGDRRGTGRPEADAPCGSASLVAAEGDGAGDLRVELSYDATGCSVRHATGATVDAAATLASRVPLPGVPAGLDDAVLSAINARESYWEPGRFLQEKGSNVYFLEAYDPNRIPVLFVHGAAGSAQDWRYILQRLDLSRFQPWLFVYASGASLGVSVEILRWRLKELQERYRYSALCITAHSMGGLLVRELLLQQPDRPRVDELFVSFSTPWGGDTSAGIGSRLASTAIPSWADLDPSGRFMTALYARRLPESVSHHLFFGYRRGTGASRVSSDGVIPLTSQLAVAAQREARSVTGFDEDHDTILRSPEVVGRYNALLAGWAQQRRLAVEGGKAPSQLPNAAAAADFPPGEDRGPQASPMRAPATRWSLPPT